jgi:hypothetical protein
MILLLACSNESAFNSTEVTDTFTQNPSEAVDILVVMDNSSSMASYQAKLSGTFDRFVEYFAKLNVDYRIGLTTTDPNDAGALVGEPISRDTPDPDQAFADMVNVGTDGAGNEMGLLAAENALENSDFARDTASLSLLMVSDEDDSSPDTVQDYLYAYYLVKHGNTPELFNLSALVVIDEDICTPDQAAQSTPGARYMDATVKGNGMLGNLCETGSRFEDLVTQFSLTATRLESRYELSREPDPDTIEVTVTPAGAPGEIVGCETGAWSYDAPDPDDPLSEPAVVFALDFMPPADAGISIRYNTGGGSGSGACF